MPAFRAHKAEMLPSLMATGTPEPSRLLVKLIHCYDWAERSGPTQIASRLLHKMTAA